MRRGKKYLEATKLYDKHTKYNVDEAIKLVRETSYAKFDATVEAAFRLNLDPRRAEQNLRGAVVLPHGTGKVARVLVIAQGEKAKEAEAAGADYVGEQDMIQKISEGWFEFDVIVATPDMMGQLGRLGRVLGPKGLMPNPKTGTVTTEVGKAVEEIKHGKIEYRVDKVGNIHVPIGKLSFTDDKIKENLKTIFDLIARLRPTTIRGTYMRNLTISSSMGPGVKVDGESLK